MSSIYGYPPTATATATATGTATYSSSLINYVKRLNSIMTTLNTDKNKKNALDRLDLLRKEIRIVIRQTDED